jgi:hypothetical protein
MACSTHVQGVPVGKKNAFVLHELDRSTDRAVEKITPVPNGV